MRSRRVRWVLASSGGGPGGGLPRDGRVGASKVMAAVPRACAKVSLPSATSSGQTNASSAFYDCAGRSQALARVAG